MFADRFIHKALKRAARHARLLTLAEGAVATLLFFACWLFFEIVLDHSLALPTSIRMILLLLLTVLSCLLFTSLVVVPFIRSISSLYVAKRVEDAFPQFKNSLITFIQLKKSAPKRSVLPLVAHQAAGGFQGIDIDASLDSTRFVRLGYVTVTLIIVVFAYSLFTPKSVWTSAMRAVYPWADIPAPTRTRISDIEPGTARMLLGSDAEISAVVYPEDGGPVSIKWSRDGELWQSVPMRKDQERFRGTLAHVETNILYCVTAGDAVSRKYVITPLVPPIVESITVLITPPPYTRLAPSRSETGSIEAAAGAEAAVTIKSNKPLDSAFIKIGDARAVHLTVQGDTAKGSFTVERSSRYTLLLTDEDSLSPSSPVEYDIVAIPDRPPVVSIRGPSADEAFPLDKPLPFTFTASDEYGLAKLAFHFESDPSNADVKNFPVPPATANAVKDTEFVPKDLGARPGDTVSYYLQAFDNRADRPNVSRTPTYTFKIADSRVSLDPSKPLLPPIDSRRTALSPPGEGEAASGTPARREEGATSELAAAPGQAARAGDASTEFAEMVEKDADVWDKIAKHMDDPSSPGQPPRPASTQDPAGAKEAGDFEGAPSPDSAAQPAADNQSPPTTPQQSASTSQQSSNPDSAGSASSTQADSAATPNAGSARQPDSAPSSADASAKSSGAADRSSSDASPSTGDSSEDAVSAGAAAPSGKDSSEKSPGDSAVADAASSQSGDSSAQGSAAGSPSEGSPSSSSPSDGAPQGDSSASAQASAAASSSDSTSPSESAPSDSSSAGATSGSGPSTSASTSTSPSSTGAPSASAGQAPASPQTAQGDASSSVASTRDPSSGVSPPASESASPSAPSASAKPGSAASSPTDSSAATASSTGPGGGGSSAPRPYAPDRENSDELEPTSRTAAPASRPGVDFARKHVSRLAADMAAGRVNRRLLDDLNWRPSDLVTFVRKYEDLLGEIDAAALNGEMVLKGDLAAGSVITGRRSSASVGALDTAESESLALQDAAAGDIPREEVAPQYKPILDEYYRSLAHPQKEGPK